MFILKFDLCLRPFVLTRQENLCFPLNIYLLCTYTAGHSENSLQCSSGISSLPALCDSLGIGLWASGLTAGTSTAWAILPASLFGGFYTHPFIVTDCEIRDKK